MEVFVLRSHYASDSWNGDGYGATVGVFTSVASAQRSLDADKGQPGFILEEDIEGGWRAEKVGSNFRFYLEPFVVDR